MQSFTNLATERERLKLHDLAVAVRHTQGTEAKVFDEFLKSLQREE